MTAAVVAPLCMSLQTVESSAEARKRRREILASQRCVDALGKVTDPVPMPVASETPSKRRKLNTSDTSEASKKPKKAQIKYDPDVPMTKEEAAVWRREQRRKRNRESAAASRQRQRDRIAELEVEVEDWKHKVESIMDKIKQLEEASGKSVADYRSPEQDQTLLEVTTSKFVSPPSSPGHSGYSSQEPESSPITLSTNVEAFRVTPTEGREKKIYGQAEQELSDKMISRQAASRITHYISISRCARFFFAPRIL